MLRRLLILVISLVFSSEAFSDSISAFPLVVYSKKATFDKILDLITYEGKVKIEYEDYSILTDKMIISTYKYNNQRKLDNVSFPNKTTIVKNDLSETIMLDSATYNGQTKELKSEGEIYIEKDNELYSAKSILLQLGVAKSWQQL